jgi:hypothetical protein
VRILLIQRVNEVHTKRVNGARPNHDYMGLQRYEDHSATIADLDGLLQVTGRYESQFGISLKRARSFADIGDEERNSDVASRDVSPSNCNF